MKWKQTSWILVTSLAYVSVSAQDFSSGDTNAVSGDPGVTSSQAQQPPAGESNAQAMAATQDPNAQFAAQDPNAHFAAQDPNAQFAAQDPNAQFATQDPNAQFATQDPAAQAQSNLAAADPNTMAADPNNLTGLSQPSMAGAVPAAAQVPAASLPATQQPASVAPAANAGASAAGVGAVPVPPPPLSSTAANGAASNLDSTKPASSCSNNCFKDAIKAAGKTSMDSTSMCQEPFVSTFDKCTGTNGCTDGKDLKKTLVKECQARGVNLPIDVGDSATPTVDGAGTLGSSTGGNLASNNGSPTESESPVTERKRSRKDNGSSQPRPPPLLTSFIFIASLAMFW